MDSNRFDTWTRTRATTTNRRSLLGWSLTAGLGAALTRLHPAAAQFDSDQAGSCTWSITLTSSLDSSQTASGKLTVNIGEGGAIDTGSLTLNGRAAASVVGQTTGPAIDLLVSLADGNLLSLTGVGGSRIDACANRITGFMANPGTGQVGTWRAQSNGGGSGQSSVPPASQTQPQTQSGSQSQGSSQPQGQDQPGGGGGDACLELHSQCNASAECCSGWCSDNECRTCGNTICGEDCIVLSDNLAHCGMCFNPCNTEIESCIDGMCVDDNGRRPDDACVESPGPCGTAEQCCSGLCQTNVCVDALCEVGVVPGFCPGFGCVDLFNDPNHCGVCYRPCLPTAGLAGICSLGQCF